MRVENEVHMQPEGQEGFPAAIQTLDLLNTAGPVEGRNVRSGQR